MFNRRISATRFFSDDDGPPVLCFVRAAECSGAAPVNNPSRGGLPPPRRRLRQHSTRGRKHSSQSQTNGRQQQRKAHVTSVRTDTKPFSGRFGASGKASPVLRFFCRIRKGFPSSEPVPWAQEPALFGSSASRPRRRVLETSPRRAVKRGGGSIGARRTLQSAAGPAKYLLPRLAPPSLDRFSWVT